MKKLVLFVSFLFFFSCNGIEKKENVTDNTYDAEQFDSICMREYEFVFHDADDSLTLMEVGYVNADYLPVEYVDNALVVADRFIRFHNQRGEALILSPEFLAEKIKRSSIDIFPCLLDEEGDRIYCVDIDIVGDLRVTFFKYPYDDNLISIFLRINEEVWNANYYEDDNVASDIKKAFQSFDDIEEEINEIEGGFLLMELFQYFDYLDSLDSESDYEEEEEEKLFLI